MVRAAEIFYAQRLIEKVMSHKNEVNFVKVGKLRDVGMQALKLGPIIFCKQGTGDTIGKQ